MSFNKTNGQRERWRSLGMKKMLLMKKMLIVRITVLCLITGSKEHFQKVHQK